MNSRLAQRWRVASLCCVGALIVLVLAWRLAATASGSDALWALLLCLPLLAPLHGLWIGKRYTYRWATLCVLPYFVVGFTEVVASPAARAWAASILVGALAWFVSLVAYLRVTAPLATNAAERK